ncbi:MAG: PH domain-containing protein [Sphingosinicella sp.]
MSEVQAPVRRLHPATLFARWFKVIPQMLLGGAGYATAVGGWGRILFFLLVAGAIGLASALIYWWRFTYAVAQSEIVIDSGLLHRRRRVIPFDRIQDIAIERPLLARLLGTARVKIETGASAADEGKLDMVGLAEAQALRDRVRRGSVSALQPAQAEPLIFAMDFGRLVIAGLFNFSLLFLALLFAFLQNLDQVGLVDLGEWITPETAESAAAYASVNLALLLVPTLLLIGMVTGLIRTFVRDYGFSLTRVPAGFRRRRGLTTLTELVIPLPRVQVALIESGLISGRLGFHALSFQTLGAEAKEGGVQAAAPFARMEEVRHVLAEAGYPAPVPDSAFIRQPRRALLRALGPSVLGFAVTAAIAVQWPWAALATGALLLVAFYLWLRWRSHGFALDGDTLFIREGRLRRRLWIVPASSLQALLLAAGPLRRRLALASLRIDTAGASLLRGPVIPALDAADADRLVRRLLDLFHARRAQPA